MTPVRPTEVPRPRGDGRASLLARAESRWGLRHDRLDHPQRDDASWFHHLDPHKSRTGAMKFTAGGPGRRDDGLRRGRQGLCGAGAVTASYRAVGPTVTPVLP
ncbi:hypothetical protein PV416_30945 [Streptomyces ipomoeae]|uniref:hypothetical protein n=1 Tax=Streptomyces ipomoeae TaxID=103232 RepID=UPI0002E77B92|nr:hypothetical protein [Streptomyces ipomoeae]MDX2693940.1 hypothetical protein [Streptomyces ipomoeae]MDX2825377.1 hypothetical protein [Streptomyces ipomoeae]MDX2839818.1 hypothetical protein [Streptomyces ipomoeae]MDX2877945.1 hypothetical protein [Streptomyces ipomoeae]